MCREEEITKQIERLAQTANRLRLYENQRKERHAGVETPQLHRLAEQAAESADVLRRVLTGRKG